MEQEWHNGHSIRFSRFSTKHPVLGDLRSPFLVTVVRGSADVANSEQRNHQEFVESITVAYLGEDARSMGQAMAAMEGDHVTLILHPETWS